MGLRCLCGSQTGLLRAAVRSLKALATLIVHLYFTEILDNLFRDKKKTMTATFSLLLQDTAPSYL